MPFLEKRLLPFAKGEFLNKCMMKAADVGCPEARQALASISLPKNPVPNRICDRAQHLQSQHWTFSAAFSIATDESTDVGDVARVSTEVPM